MQQCNMDELYNSTCLSMKIIIDDCFLADFNKNGICLNSHQPFARNCCLKIFSLLYLFLSNLTENFKCPQF